MEKTYYFVGNRYYVLQEMLRLKLNVKRIFVCKDSFLEKELVSRGICFDILPPKDEFINILDNATFDYLISNGCPYILPVSALNNGMKQFINIHPSLLPDLKGKSPINGAILFGRKHGVTCHFMDDGVDTGKIISQIEIPITNDINLDFLYQISFRMEGEVFKQAYKHNFLIEYRYAIKDFDGDAIYYSKNYNDRIIKKTDSIDTMYAKIKAFSSKGQYALVHSGTKYYEIKTMTVIENSAAKYLFYKKDEINNKILLVFGEYFVLVRLWDKLVQFELTETNGLVSNSEFITE